MCIGAAVPRCRSGEGGRARGALRRLRLHQGHPPAGALHALHPVHQLPEVHVLLEPRLRVRRAA